MSNNDRNNPNHDWQERLYTYIQRATPQEMHPLEAASLLNQAMQSEDAQVALAVVSNVCSRGDTGFEAKIAEFDTPQGEAGIVLKMTVFWNGIPVAGAMWSQDEPNEDDAGVPNFFD